MKGIPLKIKMLLAFLAVFAVVSVISFFDVFGGARSALISNSVKPLPNIGTDTDHDGLSDTDESYWNTDFQNPDTDGDGYPDGEEVVSGHSPTKAGPDDALVNDNITQKFADLTLSGLAEGSLKSDSPNFQQSVDTLSQSILYDGLTSLAPTNSSKINIIGPSKANQQQYVNYVGQIWESFAKLFGDEVQNIGYKLELTNNGGFSNPEYVSYFTSKTIEFQNILTQLANAQVPQNWVAEHNNFANILSQIHAINKAFAEGEEDTLKATMAFGILPNFIDNFTQVLKSYSDKIQSEGLNDDSISNLNTGQ